MTQRIAKRSVWRRTKTGAWTCSIGDRGVRVRLFEKTKGTGFHRSVWREGAENIRSLHTTDRQQAERIGKALLAAQLRGEQVTSSGELSLSVLWGRYKTDCVAYQGYTERMKKETEGRYGILAAFFGEGCDVRGLTEQDQIAFVRKRLAGGIVSGKDKDGNDTTPKVRPRSAQADMAVLRSMLRWATTFRVRSGMRLLDRNPLEGGKPPSRGNNPRRPVAAVERFTGTRDAIQALTNEAESEVERHKWLKLELALVLAEATGRRLGSIRQLRWDDIDFTRHTILWRAETDKKGKEWKVPMPEALRAELWSCRVKLGAAFGGLLFPSETDSNEAIRRDVFSKWLLMAEKRAGLPKLHGSLFHAYRRAWATARKDLPLGDVAAAGGWSDVGTLLRCYQQPDDATMLAVMSHSNKLVKQG